MGGIKFSIIIPVYNTEKYIKQCLDSVVHQTYSDLEIIIIHDITGDNSGNICDIYASRDERVSVFHREKGDVSSARNIGLDAATGDYIVFVDSDDWMELNFCEEMLKVINTYGMVDVIKADYFIETERTYRMKLFCQDEFEINTAGGKELLQLDIFSRYYDPNFSSAIRGKEVDSGYVWASAYNKRLLSQIRFQGSKSEDSLFNLYAIQASNRIIYKPLPLYHYRQNSGSASIRYNPQRIEEYIFYYRQCMQFIKKNKKGKAFRVSLAIRMIHNIVLNINDTIAHPDAPLSFLEKRQKIKDMMNVPYYKDAISRVKGIGYFPAKEKLVLVLLQKKCYSGIIILAGMRWQLKKLNTKLGAICYGKIRKNIT